MEGFKVLCSVVVAFQHVIVLEGFQWSLKQQSSDVINVLLGSDVSLPCEYELTSQEQQEANIFHLLTWTREDPINSNNWAGLAISSPLTGTKVIYKYPEHIFTRNDTLFVKNVSVQDHTLYQCSFQSSFFTTPSTIRLDVQYKPTDTQLTSESETVEEGNQLEITCKARANPSPKYRFYRNNNLIGPSESGVHTLKSATKSDDEGTYRCVPYNALGDGPDASISVTVKVVDPDESKFPIWKFVAIGGGALLLVLMALVAAVFCIRKNKLAKKSKGERSPASREDAIGSHVGPAMYGGQENGGHEIPHLSGAVSFSDLRVSPQKPTLRGAMSADDVRLDENKYAITQDAHLGTRSVLHLVDREGENDSKL